MKCVIRNRASVLLFVTLAAGALFAEIPQWWVDRSIVDTNAEPRDHAAAIQGQAKHLAEQTYLEFEDKLGGVNPAISNLVFSFSETNNYLPLNQGQLKTIAIPFYDQIDNSNLTNVWPEGMTSGPYPWSGLTNAPRDYAMANIGQLKRLFSFNLSAAALDTDGDDIPDWWEQAFFGGLGRDGTQDQDADGLSDLDEFLQGADPTEKDSDGDGIEDGEEVHTHGTNPIDVDSDDDQIGDGAEVAYGEDPDAPPARIFRIHVAPLHRRV